MQLCYNAWVPNEILEACLLKTSQIDGRDRGLSLSSNLDLWGHGPFKFIFKPDLPWYALFKECKYGLPARRPDEPFTDTRIYKPEFFREEQEYWSPINVRFKLTEIEKLIFMSHSPGARIHPRICVRRWKELQEKWGGRLRLEEDANHYPPL
jgi:hypothetical protein